MLAQQSMFYESFPEGVTTEEEEMILEREKVSRWKGFLKDYIIQISTNMSMFLLTSLGKKNAFIFETSADIPVECI